MVSFKVLFAVVLVLAGSQATLAKPQPRYLNQVILDVMKIYDIVITKVNAGIAEADPLIDEIQGELSDKLAAKVDKLRDDLKDLVGRLNKRGDALVDSFTKALDQLEKTIAPCLRAAEPEIDGYLQTAEDQIAAIIERIRKENQDGLDDLRLGADNFGKNLDKVIDKAIADGLACVKPGSTGVKACLDKAYLYITGELKKALADLALILVEAQDVLGVVIGGSLNETFVVVNSTRDDMAPALEKFGTCVQNTKPVVLY